MNRHTLVERNHYLLLLFMDTIYEWVNPRIPVEYVLLSFITLTVIIVMGMLMIKGNRIKRFVLGALLADYYFLVLCSTVICRSSSGERQMVLMPFWKYPDIWNKVDYPADLLEVLLNIALFMPVGLLLGGMGMKFKRVFLCGVVLSGIIEMSQFAFCRGLCETDDVIHNTLGCVIGYFLVRSVALVRSEECGLVRRELVKKTMEGN